METEYIMGLPVDVVKIETIIDELPKRLVEKEQITCISVNPQIVTHAAKYPEVVEFLKSATYRIPDGIGIVKVSQRQGGQITERVAGIDLMVALLTYANDHSLRIFLYGAQPEVVKQTAVNLSQTYPKLKVAGYIDGYTKLSDQEIVDEINRTEADMLFVALGFPKQEKWLAANYQQTRAKVFQDVGGSFDVISGTVKRAPDFFIKHNLEWAYRSLSNPKRMYRIMELPVFMWKSLRWHKKNHSQQS